MRIPPWGKPGVHNARELRCGKVLEKLSVLPERMRAMLVRFLDTVQVAGIPASATSVPP